MTKSGNRLNKLHLCFLESGGALQWISADRLELDCVFTVIIQESRSGGKRPTPTNTCGSASAGGGMSDGCLQKLGQFPLAEMTP